MNAIIIVLFCVVLIGCVAAGKSVIGALLIGLALFVFYGKWQKHSWRSLWEMSLSGVKTVRNILITFLFIGMLTALWRASGCIASIICYTSGFITPSVFLLVTFLLCSGLSFLTGTSFGTAATVGVICMSIARTMQMDVFWVGGAILSGAFFGDRCSPVSTSCLLVCDLTKTDIYENIRRMMKTALVPFLCSCLIYLGAGFLTRGGGGDVDVYGLFRPEFSIHPLCLLPAAVILVLAFLKVSVRKTMGASILTALPIAIFLQHLSAGEALRTLVTGFSAADPQVAAVMDGGGILSMVRVACIVCIASCYSGLFRGTGLLDFLEKGLRTLARKTHPFFSVLVTSVPSSMISCNQTLAIMLTHQLCERLGMKKEALALYLEDTVVMIAALIPWSIAGTVPMDSIGAPYICLLGGVYLYLVPLWQGLVHFRKVCRRKRKTSISFPDEM